MGITGLLPLLREAQRSGHVREFSGQTVGVDSYIWLYKGAFGCASELALNQPTTKYIAFFMTRARMLRHYNIEPYFVFDGGPLPSKQHTELERNRSRTEKRQQGLKFWNQGNKKKAYEFFTRSVEVMPWMAKAVIDELKKEGFRYLVAPYEADAQLAFLETRRVISACISEDSDLVVFGCRNVIFKLDQYGEATIFDRSLLSGVKAVDISGWSEEKIRHMCILSGCDYAASIPGVGLKKAHRYVSRSTGLERAVGLMRDDGFDVPEGYLEEAVRADLTFRYQRVYDPDTKCIVHVTESSVGMPDVREMAFVGGHLEPHVAEGIAMARIDPITQAPFDQHPSSATVTGTLIAGLSNAFPVCADTASSLISPLLNPPQGASKPTLRAKNLLSFWAKPKPVVISATPSASPSPVLIVDDKEEGVQVKFRARDTSTSEVVATSQQSRFFSGSVKASSSPTKAADITKTATPKRLAAVPILWPETPISYVDSQSQHLTQQQQQDDDDDVLLLTPAEIDDMCSEVIGFDQICASSFLESPTTATLANYEEKHNEGAYYLFDQLMSPQQRSVPHWVANPIYTEKR
ncbi:PIN domain-like protein [Kickxella alabastrina]|uniref:PIN domain-like protein n=1 Tax=Kickxella alabastrina TaxID=61397 RepID=UPI00221F70F4|nr:PIN domain-like protein [Kickxella alabastrina]KAI7821843.1 PIN domain-like protein [Kickxella alabastrina]